MPRRPIPVEMSQQGSHVTSEYRRGTSAVVIGLSAAFCAVAVMLAMLVALMLTRSHRAYEQQARSTAESLVTPAQANVASGLYRVDAIMLSVLDELHRTGPSWPPANELVNAMLRSRNVLLPDIEGLRIADAQGNLQWGIELPSAATVQIADRDYFVLAKARLDGSLIVAGPLQSRVSGNWVLALVRPIIVRVMTAQRSGTRVAVCYMDLDGFKAVNDVYGHDAGANLCRVPSPNLCKEDRYVPAHTRPHRRQPHIEARAAGSDGRGQAHECERTADPRG